MATPSLTTLPPPSTSSTFSTNADTSSTTSSGTTTLTSSDSAITTTSTIPSSSSSISSTSSTPTPSETPSHSSGLTKGQISAIIGASVAGAIGLIFFFFLMSVLLRRRKKTRINTFRPTSVAQFIEQGESMRGSSYFERSSGIAPLLGGSRPSTRYSDYPGQDVDGGSTQPRSSMEPPHPPYRNAPNTMSSSSETTRGLNAPPMTTEFNSQTAGPVASALAASGGGAGQGPNLAIPPPPPLLPGQPPPLAPQQRSQAPPPQHRHDQYLVGRQNTSDTASSKYSQASAPGGAPSANLTQQISWPSAPAQPSRDNSLFLGQPAPLEGTASASHGSGQGRSIGPRSRPSSGSARSWTASGSGSAGNVGEYGEYARGQGRTSPQSERALGPN